MCCDDNTLSIAAVATTSGLWLAYDHRCSVMASGNRGSIETEITTSFRRGRQYRDRYFDRLDVCSVQPLKLDVRRLAHKRRKLLPTGMINR